LKRLYKADFRDQFISFRQFHSFYEWLDKNKYVDPKIPLGNTFVASLDDFKDAEILLGLEKSYTTQELTTKYRTLMKQVHPDIAGPNDIARRLTEARDLIKGRRGWK
jgi:adenine specific DNA methylase Mod